jgi:hypothetical protein
MSLHTYWTIVLLVGNVLMIPFWIWFWVTRPKNRNKPKNQP